MAGSMSRARRRPSSPFSALSRGQGLCTSWPKSCPCCLPRHDSVTVAGAVLGRGPDPAPPSIPAGAGHPALPARLSVPPAAWHGLVDRVDPDLAPVWGAVTGYVRRGDLAAAFRLLQGRGAGLTPSGDDVLAGILLVGAVNPGCRGALDRLGPLGPHHRAELRLPEVGRGRPEHPARPRSARRRPQPATAAEWRGRARSLAAMGATSGRALVAGVALAATELPPTAFAPTMAPRPAVV